MPCGERQHADEVLMSPELARRSTPDSDMTLFSSWMRSIMPAPTASPARRSWRAAPWCSCRSDLDADLVEIGLFLIEFHKAYDRG
jgi:hypothetical protein